MSEKKNIGELYCEAVKQKMETDKLSQTDAHRAIRNEWLENYRKENPLPEIKGQVEKYQFEI